jgi:hypothetical protein
MTFFHHLVNISGKQPKNMLGVNVNLSTKEEYE